MSRPDVPRYSRVSSRFWTDEESSGWNDRVKLAALYVMTCSHRTLEGIFKLPHQYACADLHWTTKTWNNARTFLEESGFLKWDSQKNVILIVNALRYQAPENPNQAAAAFRRIRDLPKSQLLQEFYALAVKHCYTQEAGEAGQGFVEELNQQLGVWCGLLLPPLNLLSESESPTPTSAQTPTESLPPRRRAGEDAISRNVVTKGRNGREAEKGLTKIGSTPEEKWPHLRNTE